MYGTYDNITSEALRLGACDRLHAGMSLVELSELLRSPQGREWASLNDWPTSGVLENIPADELMRNRIFPDVAGTVDNFGTDWVFVGPGTNATVRISGTEALHHIVALDGARVRVEASGHAVASIDVSASARVEIINMDNTAIVSCHRKGN